MPIVNIPVYGDVEFPDSLSKKEIETIIEKEIFKGQMREYGLGETAAMGLERGVTTSARTLAGGRSDEVTPDYEDPITGMMGTAPAQNPVETDEMKELKFRIARDQNPWVGYSTQIAGSLADPVNFLGLPFGAAKTLGQFVRQGVVGGTVAGGLEPVYEEFGDSRATNIAAGAVGGGVITAGIGKAFGKYLFPDQAAKVDPDAGPSSLEPGMVKGFDEEGNPITVPGTPKTDIASETEPSIKPSIEANPADQQEEIFKLPVLPPEVGNIGQKGGRYGNSTIQWESEVDALLYSLGKTGKEKATTYPKLMNEAMRQLGMTEQEVLSMAKKVREEVIETGKQAQREAAKKGEKKVDSFKFNLSKVLDNHYFPVTKKLDENSTFVYNYGKSILPDASGKMQLGKLNMASPTIQRLVSTVKAVNPQYTTSDVFMAAQGYTKLLDEMKKAGGRNFKPRSFEDVLANKLDEDSWLHLHASGKFDGCP